MAIDPFQTYSEYVRLQCGHLVRVAVRVKADTGPIGRRMVAYLTRKTRRCPICGHAKYVDRSALGEG